VGLEDWCAQARPARWQSAYGQFGRWRREGTFGRIAKWLRIRFDWQGKVDWRLRCIDGTSVPPARLVTDRSKGAPRALAGHCRRRQGVQLLRGPAVTRQARHRRGDPTAKRRGRSDGELRSTTGTTCAGVP
jgi:hypothetical protein